MALKIFKIFENKNFIKLIYLLSFLVNILLYFTIFSKITQNGIEYYFNSDTLYFPTLFKDLFKDGYSFKGWHVPAAPNFLPDMLLYFILMAIFKNPIYASFSYGIIQFIILLLLINWLINIVSGRKEFILNSAINLLLTFFFFVYIFSKDFLFTFHIISNTYHLGAFLFFLISIILTLKYLLTDKKSFLYLLFIISSIAVLNDKLYIILFSVPLLTIFVFINKYNKKKVLNLLIVNLFSVLTGILLFRLIQISGIFYFVPFDKLIDISKANYSFQMFVNTLKSFIKPFSFKTTILLISILTFIIITLNLTINCKKYFFNKFLKIQNNDSIQYFYFLFIGVSSFITFFAPILSGTYLDDSCIRYNIFSFYMLFFNFLPAIYFLMPKILINKKNTQHVILLLSVFSIIYYIKVFFSHISKEGLKEYFHYYPESAQCIDKFIEKNKNIYGTATYWIGKVALNFSKKGARIYTVYDDSFYPYAHVGNINWYRENKGKYNNPIFNFIVVDKKQNLSGLIKNFGTPIKIDTCKKYLILTYPYFKFNKNNEPYFINLKIEKHKYFCDFEDEIFRFIDDIIISNKKAFSGQYSNLLNNSKIYSYTFTLHYDEIKNLNPLKAQIGCKLFFNNYSEVHIVFSIEKNQQTFFWKNLKICGEDINVGEWHEYTLPVILPENIDDEAIIKAFVWNNGPSEVYVDDLSLIFY